MKRRGPAALMLLLAVVIVSGCSLSAEQMIRLDRITAEARQDDLTCDQQRLDRCAEPSALMDRAHRDMVGDKQSALLVETGEVALALRIHMIRAAKKRVDLQYFIFKGDESGRLLMQELLSAARRGVKVRVLFDQLFSVSDLNLLTGFALSHENIKVRLYNPTFNEANTSSGEFVGGLACCFRRFNQRMHNKLFLVDSEAGITGGRNISDRYFDYDLRFNFKDRDVMVTGDTVNDMTQSFEDYWQSSLVQAVQYLDDVAERLLEEGVPERPDLTVSRRYEAALQMASDPDWVNQHLVGPLRDIEFMVYFADVPGKPSPGRNREHMGITQELHDLLSSAKKSVVIQSPYLVLSREARRLFKSLRKEHPDIELTFSTNSLAATDAFTAYALGHKKKKTYVKSLGFRVYEMKPFPEDMEAIIPRYPLLIAEKAAALEAGTYKEDVPSATHDRDGPRLAMHSKSFVVDQVIVMIGSHNFDPRSEGFNTENGLIIIDKPFALSLEALILKDTTPGNAWIVAAKPKKVPVVSDIGGVLEDASRSLPVFDVWPFRSTSAFELIEGEKPVPPGHPEFFERYRALGSFPEVIRKSRQLQTRLIGSFFGFLAPIM